MCKIKINATVFLIILQIFLVAAADFEETCESDQRMEEQCLNQTYKIVKPLLNYLEQVKNELKESEIEEKKFKELNVKIHEKSMREAALLDEYKNKVMKGEIDLQSCQIKVDKLESEINSLQNIIVKLKGELADKSTNLENCELQFKNLNSTIIENIQNNTEYQKTLELNLEESKTKLIKQNKDIQICQSEIDTLHRTSENIREQQKKIELQFKDGQTKLIEKVKENQLCQSKIDTLHRTSENIREEQKKIELQFKDSQTKLLDKVKENQLCRAEVDTLQRTSENIREQKNKIELQFKNSQTKLIDKMKENQLCQSKIDTLHRTSENIREQQKKIELQFKDSQTKLLNKVKENQQCRTEVDTLNKTLPNTIIPSSCSPFGDYPGIHEIRVSGVGFFDVLCDSQLAGPGWIVIQQRVGGIECFNRDWATYRKGFGSYNSDFFLGLEKIHRITSLQRSELYIHLVAVNGTVYFARYDDFKISNEDNGYKLSLGKFKGNVYDGMRYGDNMKFSTFDRDNDYGGGNCAKEFSSGWWYNSCYVCNYNLKHLIHLLIELKEIKMLIRPKQ
ncbi:fibroleukin-like [Drosophila nasuta]|uniref:fibroleukin-like n=1 Tax=Drosophila nasuta TaxID=42062 RepID=UPI00295EB07C|nr:fibroleukin-like [Drosophila nasuta]